MKRKEAIAELEQLIRVADHRIWLHIDKGTLDSVLFYEGKIAGMSAALELLKRESDK